MNNLAILYQQFGEYEFACETFEKGLVCALKSRNQRVEALILTGLGDLYSEVEEFHAALQAYQQAEIAASELPSSFISNYLFLAKGNLALLQGDLEWANRILKDAKKNLRTSRSTYERGLYILLEGRLQLLKIEPKKAIAVLKECKNLFVQDGRDLEILWSMIWLAAAYEQAGQREEACTEIRQVMITGTNSDHALVATLRQASPWLQDLKNDLQIGRQFSGLLEKSQRLTIKLPSVRRILRHRAQSVQIPSAGNCGFPLLAGQKLVLMVRLFQCLIGEPSLFEIYSSTFCFRRRWSPKNK